MPKPATNPCHPIPARAGIGLRAPHYATFLREDVSVAWLEVHSENFFAQGGSAPALLEHVAERYPLSLHGVGLALGSVEPLDLGHVASLRRLIDRYAPALVSEHLCWGAVGGVHLNDLLPLPYTEEALDHFVARVDQVQDLLGRRLLIENVSAYLEFSCSEIPEAEFLVAVARRTGCGILLDVNNLYVNACNNGIDAHAWLDAIPPELIGEVHLAGHTIDDYDGCAIRIDTHNRLVCAEVFELYARVIARAGPKPTLIEWDSDLPALDVLLDEARKADRYLEQVNDLAA